MQAQAADKCLTVGALIESRKPPVDLARLYLIAAAIILRTLIDHTLTGECG